ncbi:hypothetical protein CHS0354_026322 [Potamilus streckersoni]|uniref:Uncharacterized protein n=1 Tax=Potamilus streckersoni TaxID=2493646 RepID=A0AAE0W782_9BIVA|nr:hypothetical protein CHS0354_026322 [Potamilus streckersoni]
MDTLSKKYLLVAAIDFGTTYSGYAFSFRGDYMKNPLKISTNVWTANSRNLLSPKVPTSVLFDPNKQFHSFGFDAEEKYADLALGDKANDWYFFSKFKMTLYNQKTINRNFEIVADNGKMLSAMTVFSSCIKYLVDHLLEVCNDQVIGLDKEKGSDRFTASETEMDDDQDVQLADDSNSYRNSGLQKSDIRWVLTVPAIWNDAAKQFMREAAEKAGIASDQLLIALEPEAASIFCQTLQIKILAESADGLGPFQPGDKYLILDAGGGTIDITVHKVHSDGTLRELHAASGGDWGGTKVDKAFYDLLVNIVGKSVMREVDRNDKSDYLDLFREFEVKKRKFNPGMTDHITMKVPLAMCEIYEKERGRTIKEAIDVKSAYNGKISWVRDKMRIEADLAKGFFSDSCKKIGKHLEKMFSYPVIKNVSNILMVGGYSESPILQDYIKKKFAEKKVIIPSEPGLAILKGAVMFGFKPHVIAERICRYTYGCSMSVPFIRGVHPLDKRYITDHGTENCVDVFEKFAEIGEPIKTYEPQYETARVPADRKQKEITTRVFASVEENPKYVTDKSCVYLGTIKIPLVEAEGLDRRVRLKIFISGTEIEVEAEEENTSDTMLAKLEFLG